MSGDDFVEFIVKLTTYKIVRQCLRNVTENERMPIGFYKACRARGMYLHTRNKNVDIFGGW